MELCIDVGDLQPPEPMERILDTLADMAPDDWLRVLHRRDPVPLYRILRDMGYRHMTLQPQSGQFEVVIWPQHMDCPVDRQGEDLAT